jgi:DNA-binding LacI/PurR family transcriptional regulator/DNA-binding transcriptional regulator YhcF (GntR family)
MSSPSFSSITTQVTGHLRQELRRGRWKEVLPGRDILCRELGASPKTIRLAIDQLEKEGLLKSMGKGRRRHVAPHEHHANPALKIRVFLYEDIDRATRSMLDLQQRLSQAGHDEGFAERNLTELKMDVSRVAAHVAKYDADAWVVLAGSRDVLEWFAKQPFATFAMLGRMRGLPIAGAKPDKIEAQREALHRLHALGHRRIVQLVSEERVRPNMGLLEQAFLSDLETLGISTGPYNLAEWVGGRKGFHERLRSLFRHSPPTALFIPEASQFMAAQQFLARLGIHAPERISLICDDPDPVFDWCDSPVAHIGWTYEPIIRRIVRWADNVARAKEDRRQTLTKATFVAGGTIGPVPMTRK